jgi:hypothetical protein
MRRDGGGGILPQCPRQIGQERGAGQDYWVLFWRVIEDDDISLGLCDLRFRQWQHMPRKTNRGKSIALDLRFHLSWPPKRRENGAGQLHLGK